MARDQTKNQIDKWEVLEFVLEHKLCVGKIESQSYVHDPLNVVPNKPFSYRYAEWEAFKNKLGAECEFWSFSERSKGFNPFVEFKKQGFCITLNGNIKDKFYTSITSKMNLP